MGYCRWAPAMLPRARSKVSASTGAGVPLTSTSQPRCQWEEGTQGECRPPECAAGQPLSGSITRGVRATRRAHLRALPSAMRRKPPLVLLHSLGFPRNLAWICIRGVSQCAPSTLNAGSYLSFVRCLTGLLANRDSNSPSLTRLPRSHAHFMPRHAHAAHPCARSAANPRDSRDPAQPRALSFNLL